MAQHLCLDSILEGSGWAAWQGTGGWREGPCRVTHSEGWKPQQGGAREGTRVGHLAEDCPRERAGSSPGCCG